MLKSQFLGILLALTTAIGCIYYEKIVENFTYITFLIILTLEVVFLWILGFLFMEIDLSGDVSKFFSSPKFSIYAFVYILTGITSILWFIITKTQGVMVGSIYEVKYIVMMAIIYYLIGDREFTWELLIGVILAIGSIYFISQE